MATIVTLSKIPDAWRNYGQNKTKWNTQDVKNQVLRVSDSVGSYYFSSPAYLIDLPENNGLAEMSIRVSLNDLVQNDGFKVSLYDGDTPLVAPKLLGSVSHKHNTTSTTAEVTLTIALSAVVTRQVCLIFECTSHYSNFGITSPLVSYKISVPTLELDVSPTPVYTGEEIQGTIREPFGQIFTVLIAHGNTELETFNTSASNFVQEVKEDWFSKAGVITSSLTVSVTIKDTLTRTASHTIQVKKPVSRTATATAPKSGTFDGAGIINFSWSSSGDGEQTRSQLQWSQDNAIWSDLADIQDKASLWVAPVACFPGGLIYWRVRVYSSFGLWGEWSSAATFTVKYDAVSQTVPVNSPTSGIISAAAARTFSIALEASGPVYAPFTVSAATFYWRSGESGDFTAVAMTANGNSASVTIPAGTFPSGRLEWYAAATDNTNRTTETAHYILTAMQTVVEAAPLRPINVVESGSGPITFVWTYGSLDGSEQSRALLQYSTDGTDWTDFADQQGAEASYTAPGGTFPGGTVYWRVQAYNAAGTAGPWSDAVTFISYAAPLVQGVTGDGKPFLTISWQTEGQLAYEIEVDGTTYGPYFGEDVRTYTLTEPLADGAHTVKVRAQNKYGLWSTWAEGNVSVTNVPGPQLTIFPASSAINARITALVRTLPVRITQQPTSYQGTTGTCFFGVGATTLDNRTVSFLWYYRDPGGDWQIFTGGNKSSITFACASSLNGRQFRCKVYNAVSETYSQIATYYYASPNGAIGSTVTGNFIADTGYLLVYRDGKPIAKTLNGVFYDRTALGTHEYYYIQPLPNGYYTKSNVLQMTITVECNMIAPLDDRAADFTPCPYVDDLTSNGVTITRSINTVKTQYSGATYPAVEIGEGQTLSASLSTFWREDDNAGALALEALLGQAVILKTPQNRVFVGVLDRLPGLDLSYKRAYTISLEQMEWRDFTDETVETAS